VGLGFDGHNKNVLFNGSACVLDSPCILLIGVHFNRMSTLVGGGGNASWFDSFWHC
jgi:hypothetical protein